MLGGVAKDQLCEFGWMDSDGWTSNGDATGSGRVFHPTGMAIVSYGLVDSVQ
jgi:hypothetical protein